MDELSDFLEKLKNCNLIVLTIISDDRTYSRFFLKGVYTGRMYVSDPTILEKLQLLKGEGDEIDTKGVSKLKQHFLAV